MSNDIITEILNNCEGLRKAEKNPDAIRILTDALKEHSDARLHHSRGLSYECAEYLELALADYTTAIDLDPDNAAYYLSRGNVLIRKLDRDKDAICDFEKVVELDPSDIEMSMECSLILLRQDMPDRALMHAMAARELAPEYADTHFCVGEALMKLKQFHDAAISHRRAVELDSEVAPFWSSLAEAHFQLGSQADLAQALDACTTAIRLAPNFVRYYFSRAQVNLRLDNADSAIADLQHALTLNPHKDGLQRINRCLLKAYSRKQSLSGGEER